MLLRNKSDVSVTIRTMQGFKKVAPKETLEIPDNSLLTAIHPNLEVVKNGEIIEKLPVKSTKASEVEEQGDADKSDDNKQEEEQAKEENQEEPLTDKEQVVLTVQEESSENILANLEEKLVALQKNWEITTRPKKKEQIQKEIQALKAQIDRIKESN
jgi:hypothetical protein